MYLSSDHYAGKHRAVVASDQPVTYFSTSEGRAPLLDAGCSHGLARRSWDHGCSHRVPADGYAGAVLPPEGDPEAREGADRVTTATLTGLYFGGIFIPLKWGSRDARRIDTSRSR